MVLTISCNSGLLTGSNLTSSVVTATDHFLNPSPEWGLSDPSLATITRYSRPYVDMTLLPGPRSISLANYIIEQGYR